MKTWKVLKQSRLASISEQNRSPHHLCVYLQTSYPHSTRGQLAQQVIDISNHVIPRSQRSPRHSLSRLSHFLGGVRRSEVKVHVSLHENTTTVVIVLLLPVLLLGHRLSLWRRPAISPPTAAVSSSSSELYHLASTVRKSHTANTSMGWQWTLRAGVARAARTLHVAHPFAISLLAWVRLCAGFDGAGC